MAKKLRVTKNGHYSDCLLSSIDLITDINVKCYCGRPLPATLGCAHKRVYCMSCYRQLCDKYGYNPKFSYCLNRRLDGYDIDQDERMALDIADVAEYISNVPEWHFNCDTVNRQKARIQKQNQMDKWHEAEALAEYWRRIDPGSYHDSESDDSIVSADYSIDDNVIESELPDEIGSNEDRRSILIDLVSSDDSIVENDYSIDDNVIESELPDEIGSDKYRSPIVIDLVSSDEISDIDLSDEFCQEPPRKRRRLLKKSDIKKEMSD